MNEDAERLEARLLGTDRLVEGALVAVGSQGRVFRVVGLTSSGKVMIGEKNRAAIIPAGTCRVLLPSEVRVHEAGQDAAVARSFNRLMRALARIPHNPSKEDR